MGAGLGHAQEQRRVFLPAITLRPADDLAREAAVMEQILSGHAGPLGGRGLRRGPGGGTRLRRVEAEANMNDAIRFLNALGRDLPADERLIMCGFTGDPDNSEDRNWRPKTWAPGRDIPFGPTANAYVAVSSFVKGQDRFDRRSENFAAGRALMVDDVGTKVPRSAVTLRPSAIVETSPDNEQWWYILKEPERDQERFGGLIKAFISGKLLGADPGMAGVNRVGRLPGFFNGKAKYDGFTTRLLELNDLRFTVAQLLVSFGLKIEPPRPPPRITRDMAKWNVQAYYTVESLLRRWKMLKGRANPSGWTKVHCPWRHEHTTGAETAAIREPARENGYTGAFSCRHGHCVDRHWNELTEWINDICIAEQDEVNRNASAWLAEALRRKPLPSASSAAKLGKKKPPLGLRPRTALK
jgi:hypothetical protein